MAANSGGWNPVLNTAGGMSSDPVAVILKKNTIVTFDSTIASKMTQHDLFHFTGANSLANTADARKRLAGR